MAEELQASLRQRLQMHQHKGPAGHDLFRSRSRNEHAVLRRIHLRMLGVLQETGQRRRRTAETRAEDPPANRPRRQPAGLLSAGGNAAHLVHAVSPRPSGKPRRQGDESAREGPQILRFHHEERALHIHARLLPLRKHSGIRRPQPPRRLRRAGPAVHHAVPSVRHSRPLGFRFLPDAHDRRQP